MLRPDDFEIGEFVIIREFVDVRPSFESDPYEGYYASARRAESAALVGVPLKIIAVDMPFVALLCPNGARKPLDVRTFIAMKASDSFVQAFFPKGECERPKLTPLSWLLGRTSEDITGGGNDA